MTDKEIQDEINQICTEAEAEDPTALIITMSNVRLIQNHLADAMVTLLQMPNADLSHHECQIALANIFLGLASDWLRRSGREELRVHQDVMLSLVGRMSAAIVAMVPAEGTEEKVN